MNKPLRLALLAVALPGLMGCPKKDTPPPAAGVGRYQLDTRQNSNGQISSRVVNAQAKFQTSTDTGYDFLVVQLVTTPQPASGPETLKLYFSKPVGQPSTAYTLDDIITYDTTNPQGDPFTSDAATIVATSNGGFSGTFSGDRGLATGGFSTGTYVQLKTGTFTDARP